MTNLLLLHGALGAAEQLAPIAAQLNDHYTIHTLDFEGHGPQPLRNRPFSIEAFAENVLEYLGANLIDSIDIFGYSMGGYVALHLARTTPGRIGRIMTLGTKFKWSPQAAAREVKMLDADTISAKVPAFATALEARHTGAGWKTVLEHTAAMMTSLGDNPLLGSDTLSAIEHPVRIGLGDRDRMVSIEETVSAYRALPNAELQILPSTPHPLEAVDAGRVAAAVREFF